MAHTLTVFEPCNHDKHEGKKKSKKRN